MSAGFSFALLNASTRLMDDAQLTAMADGIRQHANEKFAPAWGIGEVVGGYYPDPHTAPKDAMQFVLLDQDGAVPNALGFHDEQGGIPYAEVLVNPILDNGGGVLDGGSAGCSLASVFAHELYESMVDEYVNDWVLMPSGIFLAKETGDPVQMVLDPVTLPDGTVVQSSNAVTPHYFDAQAPTDGSVAFDLAGKVSMPFQLLPGGYQIVLDPAKWNAPGGPISNVWGREVPDWMRALKGRAKCRTFARNARLILQMDAVG